MADRCSDFRHGDILMMTVRIDDPAYLTKPFYLTRTFQMTSVAPSGPSANRALRSTKESWQARSLTMAPARIHFSKR